MHKRALPAAATHGCILLLLVSGSCEAYSWTSDRPPGNASVEYLLKQSLLRGYDTTSRPVRVDATPVDTRVGMSLFHILDTNERHQTISAQVSIRVHWWDEYLTWDLTKFPIKKFWIPAKSIWRPDLIITNYANDEYSDYMNTNAIVEVNGKIMWTFPIVVKMYCTLDVRYFPFDTQDCNVTFVSWTYDGLQVALNHTGQADQKVYYNARNQEWKVTGITPHQELVKYPCCDVPFPVIHFTIRMYRRCLFYVVNLICPCLLIYFVSFLGFYLPIESGEKVNLEITVLLALVVFLLMVSETMPPTPDAIPILGLLFTVTMTMVALAVVMAVTVTRVYFSHQHRTLPVVPDRPPQRPPVYIQRLARLQRRWTQPKPPQPKPPPPPPIPSSLTLMRRQLSDSDRSPSHSGRRGRRPSLDSLQETGLSVSEIPPSASYFKGALQPLQAGNGGSKTPQSPLPPSPPLAALTRRRSHDRSTDAEDLVAEECKLAAFALDRIFFWVFAGLTLAMCLAICAVAAPAFADNSAA